MPFDTIPTAADAARSMIGKAYQSERAFLEGFLLRLGIPVQRNSYLEEHLDQVGAWTDHLRKFEIPEFLNGRNIHAGDLFLQRRGGRDWSLWIVTEARQHQTFYMRGRWVSDGVKFIRLQSGVVVEREFEGGPFGAPFDGRQSCAPNMFRFPAAEAGEVAA